MINRCILIVLLLCRIIEASAQQGTNIVLYSLTEKDGLTDNLANCFYQDSQNIIWIGTNYGLNSFDGSVIKNYHYNKNTASLANDAVNDIKEGKNKTLWIATGKGLSSYDLTTKKFETFVIHSNDILNRFYSLAVVGNSIWLATEEGLVEFSIDSKTFAVYKNPATPADNRITRILADSKKRIWLCTYNGVWLFDAAAKKFSQFDSPANDPLFYGLITDIFEDHSGQLWFGTWSKGLKKLNPEKKIIENFSAYKNSNGNVTSITEQKNTDGTYSLWQSSNLCKPDFLSGSFEYLYANNKPISTNRLYCDAQNLLWISTNDGIKIYNPARQYFQTTILSAFVPLTSQGIALFPLKNSFLLGGEGGTSLMLFSDAIRQVKNLSSSVTNGAAVMNIQQDSKKNYWLCTSGGLLILDSAFHQKELFVHRENDNTSLPKNFLNYALIKNDGEVWLLPWRKGIWKADITAHQFYRVITKKGDTLLQASNLSKAVEDKNGNIWITDYSGGLFKYEPATGAVENIIKERRLSNEYLVGGKLWTVSASEIFCTDISNNQTATWNLPEGKNKYEYDFIPDDNGWLWIATKTGMVAFNMQTHSFKSFTADDGLQDNNMDVTFTRLSNGNILFVSGTYATWFSPRIVQQESNAAPLIFTNAFTDEKEKIAENGSFHFSWDDNNIQLNWALLNYSNPLSNIYYYKLDGINKDWQTAGNKGQVSFNSLAPGNYIFHFKAATSQGVMSGEKTIQLVIHPPLWKTWWFILMAILFTAILFYAVVKYISQRNLKEKLLRLEKEQAIEKERNRISRDMHDELGSGLTKIAILSEVIKARPTGAEKYIDKISGTARNLVDSLDEMVWALNPKNDSLDKLVAYIAEYTSQYLESTNITPVFDLPQQIRTAPVGEEKRRNIFMAVKEFLNNSVKHSNAKFVTLLLVQQDDSFEIILKDDGTGIDTTKAGGMGNGLKNMQQRIEDAGGKAALLSENGKGTELRIYFAG